MRVSRTLVAATAWLAIGSPSGIRAQDGPGSTGATVLQLLAGSRAAALSGAYTAASGDADVLFYNPAGVAGVHAVAGVSYQRHVEDIGVASGAGALRVGRVVLGATVQFLDYGSIDELVPDPAFGGQTGVATGNTVSASELAGRLAAAVPLLDGRLRVGGAVGLVSVDLAGLSRSAPLLDAGVQYVALPGLTVGAALRNAGGSLSGEDLADADLPSEARLGAAYGIVTPGGFAAALGADLVSELNEGSTGVVAGLEAGLTGYGANQLGAVARIGYNGLTGDGGLGALQLGGGVSVGRFAVDYAYQSYDAFGSLHRFGVRWARMP